MRSDLWLTLEEQLLVLVVRGCISSAEHVIDDGPAYAAAARASLARARVRILGALPPYNIFIHHLN